LFVVLFFVSVLRVNDFGLVGREAMSSECFSMVFKKKSLCGVFEKIVLVVSFCVGIISIFTFSFC